MKNFNLPDNTWDGDPRAPWNELACFEDCPLSEYYEPDEHSVKPECNCAERRAEIKSDMAASKADALEARRDLDRGDL